jgi:hypothetical protein
MIVTDFLYAGLKENKALKWGQIQPCFFAFA